MTAGIPWPALRTNANRTLPQVAEWRRPTLGSTDLGGPGGGHTVIAAAVPCRVAPAGGQEATDPERLQQQAQFVVALPFGTQIRLGDQLRLGSTTLNITAFAEAPGALLVRVFAR